MELFILRHGEAGQRSSSLAGDRKRPLTSSGKLEISEIANALKIIGLKIRSDNHKSTQKSIRDGYDRIQSLQDC